MKHYSDEFMYQYLDDKLEIADKNNFISHIKDCSLCKERFEKVSSFESLLSRAILDDNEFNLYKSEVSCDLKIKPNKGKGTSFLKKKISIPMYGMASSFAFVMVLIGTIVAFSPRTREVERVVPGQSGNISQENIYRVSDEKNWTAEDHIKALEDMGFSVSIEKVE